MGRITHSWSVHSIRITDFLQSFRKQRERVEKTKKEFWEKYTFPDMYNGSQLCFSLYFPHAHSRNLQECLPGSAVSSLPNPGLPPISKPMHPKCVHIHAEEHLSQTICTVRPQSSACLFASPSFFYQAHSGVHLKGLLWPKGAALWGENAVSFAGRGMDKECKSNPVPL